MKPPSRISLIYRLDLSESLTRPLLWVLVVVVFLTSWGLSTGQMTIQSGNSAVGGTKAWVTSEFAMAKMLSIVIFLFYSFFVAIAAGLAVMRDDEWKVGELLHATPLQPREYVWGKFLAVITAFVGVLLVHLLSAAFFNQIMPSAKAIEIRGPFQAINYLRPAILLGLPSLLFIAGTTFAIGERSRKPILVFVLPVALVLVSAFFLWNWTPSWLDPRINRILMLIDPSGVRWLSETWLKVDRGVDFYNHAPVHYDAGFLLSRLVFALAGLLAVAWDARRFEASLRGTVRARKTAGAGTGAEPVRHRMAADEAGRAPAGPSDRLKAFPGRSEAASLASLAMRIRPPGLIRGLWTVLRFELRELRNQPGLYLFVPIILLQTLGTSLVALGAFDTPLLLTPGMLAVRSMNTLTLLFCFLSLFYTVESLRREKSAGVAPVYYATPAPTVSILAGKVLANAVVGIVILLATFLGGAITILIQGKVPLSIGPLLVVWGLLLVPTFLAWTALVMALYAISGSRYTTYALGLAVLALTGWLQATNHMSWAGNWDLWSVLQWSDMGPLELNRFPLLLNRIAVLGFMALFVALALRFFPRRERDAVLTLHRAAPGRFSRSIVRLLPYLLVPAVFVIALWVMVNQGFQGKIEQKREKDYWKQNLATWKDAALPAMVHADVDLDLDPAHRGFRTSGSFLLRNDTAKPLRQIPLTGAYHWEDISWTLNGADCKPDDRSHLFVFTPASLLAPGDTTRIGFRFHGRFPQGMTKNGGGNMEFILPGGAVLTSFTPSFVPVLGYLEDIGVDDKNRYEPRVYPDDFYKDILKPAFGSGTPFTTRIRISAPAVYTINSVGTEVSDVVEGGRRTAVWVSDQPVRFFNVVAGRWNVRRQGDVAVYYHPGHGFNVAEMTDALQAARKWYSEWFYPYPWKELKLSEFPANAFYAQGFPTNITFSEGIGFLTKSEPKTNAAFFVTAHESAHQWWGNLLTPGRGPGDDILSEGMAHFSTILLFDQVKGARGRIEFCKRIEEHYGNNRRVDSERPLVKIDGSRNGDEAVTYDKGGWVFWMLLNRMGRENALKGLQGFIRQYKDGPDYPALQDFTAFMRSYAPDTTAYDEFVDQWFFKVVVPEYKLSRAERTQAGASVPGSSAGREPGAEAGTPSGGERWTVHVHVANAGDARMPCDVAAAAGERFQKDGTPSTAYHEARATVTLGKGEETDVSITCDFKPDRVLVDPDAEVLQLRRNAAIVRF